MPDPQPWQCPSCGAWMPPWIEEHQCGPDGGVLASRPESPSGPSASEALAPVPSLTTTWGAGGGGGAFTTTNTGTATYPLTVHIDGGELFAIVRREKIRHDARNRGAA